MTEQEYGLATADSPHALHRGTHHHAGLLTRAIIANHDDIPVTAHQVVADTPSQLLPKRVAGLLAKREASVPAREVDYDEGRAAERTDPAMTRSRTTDRTRIRDRGNDIGL